jgi:hypothetical protein
LIRRFLIAASREQAQLLAVTSTLTFRTREQARAKLGRKVRGGVPRFVYEVSVPAKRVEEGQGCSK